VLGCACRSWRSNCRRATAASAARAVITGNSCSGRQQQANQVQQLVAQLATVQKGCSLHRGDACVSAGSQQMQMNADSDLYVWLSASAGGAELPVAGLHSVTASHA
jgi:hypothetical protein